MPVPPLLWVTPKIVNSWLLIRIFCPVGSTPSPKRSSLVVGPNTATLELFCTCESLKKLPVSIVIFLIRA